jgi:hypothetical protein
MATSSISLICICRLVRLRIFGPGSDPKEQVWTYSFKHSTSRVLVCTSTQKQMDKGLPGGE